MPARKIVAAPVGAPWALKKNLFSPRKIRKMQRSFRRFCPQMMRETVKFAGAEYTIENRLTTAFTVREQKIYRYSGKARLHRDVRFSEMGVVIQKVAKKIEKWLKKEHGIKKKFNTAIVTRYLAKEAGKTTAQSNNGLPWHDDLTRSNMMPGTPVASFVLGEGRRVYLRKKVQHDRVFEINAEHGSVYAMLPGCQEEFDHCVPTGHDERVSITLRCVK